MAFPTVQSVTRAVQLANVSSFNITLPATINSGDLLLILLSSDGNPTYTWDNSTAGTWTELFSANQSTLNKLVAYYKTADGTEDSKVLGITTSVAERFAWHIYRITGWDSIEAATAAGNSTSPDPPNLAPSWGSADTLWLVGLGTNGNAADPVTFPTNYTTNGIYDEADNTAGCGVGSSYRTNAASSENPGTFTVSAADGWVAATIAIEPVASVDALTATGVATGAPTVGTPTLTQLHVLAATGVATGAPTTDASTLSQVHALLAQTVVGAEPTTDAAAISQLHVLNATSVAANPPISENASLGQLHAFAAENVFAGAPETGSSALSTVVILTADNAATGAPTVETAAIAQQHALAATSVQAQPVVGASALAQLHALSGENIASGAPVTGSSTAVINVALSADAIATGAPAVASPAFSQAHILTSATIATATPTVSNAAIGQKHALSASAVFTGAPRPRQARLNPPVFVNVARRVSLSAITRRTAPGAINRRVTLSG